MTKNVNELTPAYATHPGEVIHDELEARNINQKDFAIELGISATQLNEIIKGKRNISAEFALKLQTALKIDSKYWMELQSNYDLDRAKIKESSIQENALIQRWQILKEYVPISFYKKQKILVGNIKKDEDIIKEIYSATYIDDIIHQVSKPSYSRFRKSQTLLTDTVNEVGWIKLVEYKSKDIKVTSFNSKNYKDLINELKNIFLQEKIIEKTKKTLSKNGIKLVIQEKPDKAPIDGMSFWKDTNPTIGLTLRHKRLDNFVFTLFHELGHIYLHLKKNKSCEFVDDISNVKFIKENAEEFEADAFARNNLIEESVWDDFIFKNHYFDEKSITDFSTQNNLHPAIVRGRLLHDGRMSYNTKSPFLNEIK